MRDRLALSVSRDEISRDRKSPKSQQTGRYTKETKTRIIHFSNNPGRMSTENFHNVEEENDEVGALDALNTLEKEASEYKKVRSPFPYRLLPLTRQLGRRN